MTLHCGALHYITFTTPPVNIILCSIYLCVCACVDLQTRAQLIPAGWSQRGLSPRGGGGVQFDMISHAEQGGPKPVRREKSRQLRPVCPQFMAKANPTPASKLAFVKN